MGNILKPFLLISTILLLSTGMASAQWSIDTTKRQYPSEQIENFLTGSQPAFFGKTEISVFGNDDCGHCSELMRLLKENNIAYTKYDIKSSKDNYNLMLQLVDKVDKGNRTFYFPVVLVNEKLFYSIFNMPEFVGNLKKEYFGE